METFLFSSYSALGNETDTVRALMKLSLVEKTGIEQIMTAVVSVWQRKCTQHYFGELTGASLRLCHRR